MAAWVTATAFLRFFNDRGDDLVVAVPEGLPMSVTLSLAYSMRKMTATNNLVRRMHATETSAGDGHLLGQNGTLTLNQMRIRDVQFPGARPSPESRELETEIERMIAEAFSANATANLSRIPGEPVRPLGDTTEGALLLWLHERGIDYLLHREAFAVDTQLTFSAERKYMGTLGRSNVLEAPVVYIKGAPEIVLEQSTHILTEAGVIPLDDEGRLNIEDHLRGFQRRGMRTLAFSYKPVIHENGLKVEQLAQEMIWLGYIAIADPIRPEVPTAVQACRDAGIGVKIVTGDNPRRPRKSPARSVCGIWPTTRTPTPT